MSSVMVASESVPEAFATRWSIAHALAVTLAVAASAGLGRPSILAWAAGASFAVYLLGSKGRWTPSGVFGAANLVTALRLGITGLLLFAHTRDPALLAGSAFLILLLDVLDGYVARRFAFASEFGARFDVESDAFFVMTLSVLLWVRGVTGAWVLIAGLWRYVYLLTPIAFPTSVGEAKRSRFGRLIYVVLVASFIAAFVLPSELAGPAAALGTVAVSVSFLRSFWQRYGSLTT